MALSLLATEFNSWGSDDDDDDGYACCSSCFILQLLLGFARPGPKHPRRSQWRLLHQVWGHLLLLLGVANIGLGIWLFDELYGGAEEAWKVGRRVVRCAASAGLGHKRTNLHWRVVLV